MVFLLVGRRRLPAASRDGLAAAIVVAGIAATAIVLGFFAVDTLRNAPETFAAIVGIGLLSVVLDLVWKRIRGPEERSTPPAS